MYLCTDQVFLSCIVDYRHMSGGRYARCSQEPVRDPTKGL